MPSLGLFFAQPRSEKKMFTLADILKILQCAARGFLARRRLKREQVRSWEENSGERRDISARRMAMSFGILRVQKWVRCAPAPWTMSCLTFLLRPSSFRIALSVCCRATYEARLVFSTIRLMRSPAAGCRS